jgi:hypothetical protein
VAFTEEIDDVEAAVAEISEQLSKKSLHKNSIGLISCLADFLESGVVAALAQSLPFEIVGQTSIACAAPGSPGQQQLCLLVLTSDDVEFVAAHTDPITEEDPTPIAQSYAAATAGRSQKPSLIISYAPLLLNVGGDFLVKSINAASGGVPIFGSLAVDATMDYHDSQVIFSGAGSRNQMACVLVYGNVQPRFYLATISHEKVFKERGVVTASKGNQLQMINGAPVTEFLKNQGITPNEQGDYEGINSFPYLVDYNDGTDPVIRVMFAITPEGYAVCGGDIPVGAKLSIGYFDAEDILKTTSEKLGEITLEHDTSFILAFSCIGRYFTLGYEPKAETEKLRDAWGDSNVPYTFTYSGGEICPTHSQDDPEALANRFHNSTFIACVL